MLKCCAGHNHIIYITHSKVKVVKDITFHQNPRLTGRMLSLMLKVRGGFRMGVFAFSLIFL